MARRRDFHDPAPAKGMKGTVVLVAVLLAGLVLVTAITGRAPEFPTAAEEVTE